MGICNSCKKQKKKFSITQLEEDENKTVTFDDFRILRAIGKGSFGKVCIVQKIDTEKMYAMKYMNKNQCLEKDAFKNVLREIEVLTDLEHPFLVNLWFTFQDEEDMFMVVDLLLGGDLRFHLQQSNSKFDQDRVTLYICEIALALDYLRSKRILHRDVKPDNILIDDDGHVHIADFNIATIILEGEMVTSVSGTKPYMAPEIIQCALDQAIGYSFPADWWSLGITAYEMACGMRPYAVHSDTSMEESHELIHNSCIHFPKVVNKGLASLIRELIRVDPKRRMCSIKEMKKHNYLKSVDFNAVYNKQVKPSFVPCKNQLNCDPTFELEEMIIESRPLHKKKKRLSKRKPKSLNAAQINENEDIIQMNLSCIEKDFILYNRESEIQSQKIEAKRRIWEEELAKIIS